MKQDSPLQVHNACQPRRRSYELISLTIHDCYFIYIYTFIYLFTNDIPDDPWLLGVPNLVCRQIFASEINARPLASFLNHNSKATLTIPLCAVSRHHFHGRRPSVRLVKKGELVRLHLPQASKLSQDVIIENILEFFLKEVKTPDVTGDICQIECQLVGVTRRKYFFGEGNGGDCNEYIYIFFVAPKTICIDTCLSSMMAFWNDANFERPMVARF